MGELPEYIRIEEGKITNIYPGQEEDGNTYKFMDSGGSGKIYLKNTQDIVLKLIFSYDEFETPKQFKERCLEEIEKQTYAAQHNLAPMPTYHNYSSSPRFGFGSKMICYIEMKYLDTHIFPNDPKYTPLVCQFIKDLASIGLINKTDPLLHFYLDDGRVQMIDFGFVEPIDQDNILGDIQQMAKLCHIDCDISRTAMGKRKKPTKTKRKPTKTKRKLNKTKRKPTKTKRKPTS